MKGVQLTQSKDSLAEQLEIMRQNQFKNSNQICDQIYQRQLKRIKETYRLQKHIKAKNIKELSSYQEHLVEMEQQVTKKFDMDHSFSKMDYFRFIELLDKSQNVNTGSDDLSSPTKISQFCNEPIAFHLHKKGDFFKKLDGFDSHDALENKKLQSNLNQIKQKIVALKMQDEIKRILEMRMSRNLEMLTKKFETSAGQLPSLNPKMDLSQSYQDDQLASMKEFNLLKRQNTRRKSTVLNLSGLNQNTLPLDNKRNEQSSNKNNLKINMESSFTLQSLESISDQSQSYDSEDDEDENQNTVDSIQNLTLTIQDESEMYNLERFQYPQKLKQYGSEQNEDWFQIYVFYVDQKNNKHFQQQLQQYNTIADSRNLSTLKQKTNQRYNLLDVKRQTTVHNSTYDKIINSSLSPIRKFTIIQQPYQNNLNLAKTNQSSQQTLQPLTEEQRELLEWEHSPQLREDRQGIGSRRTYQRQHGFHHENITGI
eukprot:403335827